MHIFKNTNFDFLKWRWPAIALSALIVGGGIVMLVTRGMSLGIEFAGGTAVIVQFDQARSTEQVRTALSPTYPEATIQPYDAPEKNQMLIRVPDVGAETGTDLSAVAQKV